MIIKSAEFIISAVKPAQYPEGDLPEIALAGRSNVGKSSLINRMISRKSLARTSSTPGKTQQLNYYLINQQFYFVDLPGYGFAKVPKTVKEQWGKMIETYLTRREQLKAVLQLVDIRHAPSNEDQEMYQFLHHHGLPHAIVVTKADKIARGHWPKYLSVIRKTLDVSPEVPLFLVSSETGHGISEVWDYVRTFLEESAETSDSKENREPGISASLQNDIEP